MKNKRIIIFLGILVLLMAVLLVILNNNLHNQELAGKKINSWLYEYDFEEKDSIQNIIIKDNKIYYLANKEDIYELKEISIFTNKAKKIGSIKSDVCFFYNEYLSCSKGDEKIIYNLNLKEIYKRDNFFKIVPYQNSFLIISDKDIYLNNKKIRTIKDDIKIFDINNYYVKDDNIFIEFISIDSAYIYNVKEDSYEKIELDSIYSYNKGFYYGNKDKIVINNLDINEIKEYRNFINNDLKLTTLKDNLFFHIENNYLKIYNLETNKFRFIDYKFDNLMNKIIIDNNYLYMIYEGDNPKIYVIDLSKIDSYEYTTIEYEEMQKNKIAKKVQELENKYNNYIDIVYDVKDIENEKWISEIVNEDRLEMIDDELNVINKVLNKLGNDFLSTFKHDNYKGLRIVVAKGIIANKNAAVQDASGQFFCSNSHYNIILTSTIDMSSEKTFCHEIMHAIDDNASNHKYDIAGNWYDYNPKDFNYNISHFKNNNTEYTISSDDGKNAYFIDTYNKVNQYEDRARIFENICYVDGDNIIKKHPNLLKKAEYIKDELLKYYPSLNNARIFDSIG